MFPARYFAKRYSPGRYFPPVSGVTPPPTITDSRLEYTVGASRLGYTVRPSVVGWTVDRGLLGYEVRR